MRAPKSDGKDKRSEEEAALKKAVMESLMFKRRIKDYRWSSSIREVLPPLRLQEPKPMQPKERRETLQDIPDLKSVFSCPGLRSLGADRHRVSKEARWFLEKAAPTLHLGALEVVNLLAFALQEVEEGGDGSRVGISTEELGALIQKALFLQLDTIQLIASMQIHRASMAMFKVAPDSEDTKDQAILSDKVKEEVKKQQLSSRSQGVGRGNGRWGRRPRFAPESLPTNRNNFSSYKNNLNSYQAPRTRDFSNRPQAKGSSNRFRGRGRGGFKGRQGK